MLRSNKITVVFISLLFFVTSFPCFPVIVADIDTVDFTHLVRRENIKLADGLDDPSSKNDSRGHIDLSHHIRVSFFDTEVQKFIDFKGNFPGTIYYLSIIKSISSDSRTVTFADWFDITYTYQSGNLTVSTDLFSCKTSNMDKVIRCKGEVSHSKKLSQIDLASSGLSDETRPYLQSVFISSKKTNSIFPSNQYKDPEKLKSLLSKNNKRRDNTSVKFSSKFFFYEPEDPSLKGTNLSYIVTQEMGMVGELATDITMQWLGFMKKDGKYKEGSNNGFDGVYTKPQFLFISESKYYSKPPSLKKVMTESIYSKITTRLENIDVYGNTNQIETGKLIKDFFENFPSQVYLLPYIVLPTGEVKSEAKTYEEVHHLTSPIKPKTLSIIKYEKQEKEDENLQKQTLGLYQNSGLDPLVFIQSMLKALNLDKEYALIKLGKLEE